MFILIAKLLIYSKTHSLAFAKTKFNFNFNGKADPYKIPFHLLSD